jgi:hypothetical protein
MKRILSVALLATAVGVLAVVPSQAAKRGVKHRAHAVVAASQCSGSGLCTPGSCSAQSASVAAKSTKTRSVRAQMCPVSDPSACPSSCPREDAAAVASNATHR